MEGFKNTTRMKTFGDVAPQAYAKGGAVKPMAKAAPKKASAPMKKAGGGDVSKMTPAERRASMEQTSRAMTPAQAKSLQALKNAKAAAPKQGPLIKPAREMTPAERRMNQMDRPTNNMGAEAYKGGGKVGGSKVPFAVKKVMRKAEGGAVSQTSEMPTLYTSPSPNPDVPQEPTPQSVFGTSPGPMPTMPQEPTMPTMPPMPSQEPTPQSVFGKIDPSVFGKINPDPYGTSPGPMPVMPEEPVMPSAPMGAGPEVRPAYESMPEYIDMMQRQAEFMKFANAQRAKYDADQAATAQAQQEMAAQAQMDRGLGLDLGGRRNSQAPMYGRNPYLPRS